MRSGSRVQVECMVGVSYVAGNTQVAIWYFLPSRGPTADYHGLLVRCGGELLYKVSVLLFIRIRIIFLDQDPYQRYVLDPDPLKHFLYIRIQPIIYPKKLP